MDCIMNAECPVNKYYRDVAVQLRVFRHYRSRWRRPSERPDRVTTRRVCVSFKTLRCIVPCLVYSFYTDASFSRLFVI